jgi:hypothetical protein
MGPRSSLFAALVSLALLSSVLMAPSQAAEPVKVRDARGDVMEKDGLTHAERISIDLFAVRITPGERRTIFRIAFRAVSIGPDFDQMFFVVLSPRAGSGETWQSNVGTTTKGRGYAYFTADDMNAGLENCRARTTVDVARHRLTIDVPRRCLPPTEAKVEIVSATGIFESDAPTSSRDSLKIAGVHVISGRA